MGGTRCSRGGAGGAGKEMGTCRQQKVISRGGSKGQRNLNTRHHAAGRRARVPNVNAVRPRTTSRRNKHSCSVGAGRSGHRRQGRHVRRIGIRQNFGKVRVGNKGLYAAGWPGHTAV